jgi:uncharacterized damage-inducible protein DinB
MHAGTSAVLALRERLDELMRLVRTLSGEAYRARPSRVSGSVGEHVRHVLDHVSSLVNGDRSVVLTYDHRMRGTAVETEPHAAVREIAGLDAALVRWAEQPLDEAVAVTAMLSANGRTITGRSTLARELAFVMSHTIHHQAIVALLLEQQGAAGPGVGFGYAPSTPAPH